jgi:hypothetical protein
MHGMFAYSIDVYDGSIVQNFGTVDMVGLIFVDTLTLTLRQHTAIILNMAVCVYGYILRPQTHAVDTLKHDLCIACLCACILLYGFYGNAITRDVKMLFISSTYLSQFTWGQYLTEFSQHDYVKLQPPFLSFFCSRIPSYIFHQIFCIVLMIIGLPILVSLYGRRCYFLAATPLYALTLIQPGTDVWLFWWLVLTVAIIQRGNTWAGACLYGVSFVLKPLSILLFPIFFWRLRYKIVASIIIVWIYWLWSHETYFGVKQWKFLSNQIMTTHLSQGAAKSFNVNPSHAIQHCFFYNMVKNLYTSFRGTVRWRWNHLGKYAVSALWWYGCPSYGLFFKRWGPLLLTLMILIGYGNIKYLLFVILASPIDRPL